MYLTCPSPNAEDVEQKTELRSRITICIQNAFIIDERSRECQKDTYWHTYLEDT